MNIKRSMVIALVLTLPLLAESQVPTNEVTVLAVRTQEVNGVQMVLQMVAQPPMQITKGLGDYYSFVRIIECQAIPSGKTSNLLVYGWFLRFSSSSRSNPKSEWIPTGETKGDLAFTEGGERMVVFYYEASWTGSDMMAIQWYSAAEATQARPAFPEKWSASSTNPPCIVDPEIRRQVGTVLAAEIQEATARKVCVVVRGKNTVGKKRKLDFYLDERRWVLLPEEKMP